jgi:hypothetical protein
VDIPKLALTFFVTITYITDSVMGEGKLSWSNIQRFGLSYRLHSHEHPKMRNQNLWLFVVETNLECIISFISKGWFMMVLTFHFYSFLEHSQ